VAFDFGSLKDILVCPKSKSRLVCDGDALICTDPNCRLRFEIRDEIPVMLLDEATELAPSEWRQIVSQVSEVDAATSPPED
jgi:uncharacterized protein YbaR (Trm112 family)